MATLRVALMGYGAVAQLHGRSIESTPEAELAAVIGPRRQRALELASGHGDPPVFHDLQSALQAWQQMVS